MNNISNTKLLMSATVVVLSGFVPAVYSYYAMAEDNGGVTVDTMNVSVVFHQAIHITAGNRVDFGTIILSATSISGNIYVRAGGSLQTVDLSGEVLPLNNHGIGTMKINQSAGRVHMAIGAAPTDNSGAVIYPHLTFAGTAMFESVQILAGNAAEITLVGSTIDIGAFMRIISRPATGIYNTKHYSVTVTDI